MLLLFPSNLFPSQVQCVSWKADVARWPFMLSLNKHVSGYALYNNLTFIVSLSTLVQILVRHACEPIREHLDVDIASYG